MTGSTVTWRGLTARYTPAELKFMRELAGRGAANELAVIHALKTEFGGILEHPGEQRAQTQLSLRA